MDSIACTGKMRRAYSNLVEKFDRKREITDFRRRVRDNVKWVFKRRHKKVQTGYIWHGKIAVTMC
jgi:hypothetical protein